jgi:phosphate starvation-inducible PhoH-like protein
MSETSGTPQGNEINKFIDISTMIPEQIANFCGALNQNIKFIEEKLNLSLVVKGDRLTINSGKDISGQSLKTIEHLLDLSRDSAFSISEIDELLHSFAHVNDEGFERFVIKLKKKYVKPKTDLQCRYIEAITKKIVNFGIGPAGTGKTYLAVAKAVESLENEEVSRLILTRPAVEAGEKLGFLPGDLSQKVDPYLRPVYDALYEMLGFDKVEKLIERHVIEVAPLAYMRGRTLNNAFVILDEAQNTTPAQMKMFLTRIGFGSRAVVTGDITQTDLPDNRDSGLQHSLNILRKIDAIGFSYFTSEDVVRHPLVQNIVEAYDQFENGKN